jgi:hypothetical protein
VLLQHGEEHRGRGGAGDGERHQRPAREPGAAELAGRQERVRRAALDAGEEDQQQQAGAHRQDPATAEPEQDRAQAEGEGERAR